MFFSNFCRAACLKPLIHRVGGRFAPCCQDQHPRQHQQQQNCQHVHKHRHQRIHRHGSSVSSTIKSFNNTAQKPTIRPGPDKIQTIINWLDFIFVFWTLFSPFWSASAGVYQGWLFTGNDLSAQWALLGSFPTGCQHPQINLFYIQTISRPAPRPSYQFHLQILF